ncbi:N-acetylmannosamine kinase [Hyphomicrobium sp. ghe19]|uniref:ROK family protein n=1 Tax=Hyphomicrobium sp. ghe19 TaxID=2682968 RepID=UPI0013674678|nr:N-acetylmannosamine kinase [Hyphomicrobium sp. ghe19]
MTVMDKPSPSLELPTHGAATLPSVTVDSYNIEVRDDDGFVGDKASKGAFWEIVEKWRKALRKAGEDPFGKTATEELSKKQLVEELEKGDPEAAGLVQSAVEEFSQQFAHVIRRFLRTKEWRDTEAIVIGGGFRGSRLGELVAGRTGLLLKAEKINVDLEMIHNDPDDAGLIGAAHLLPPWMLKGHDTMLAVDIGGTNIRVGTVELNIGKSRDLVKAKVANSEIWCHAKDETDRSGAVARLVKMLEEQIRWNDKEKLALAPVIGIGCPGIIREDGSIDRGGQNLPGNWESSSFHLPGSIKEKIGKIGGAEAMIVMHNDAVVQGLSELPHMQDRKHWAVLTIGTGLGNARFTNRDVKKAK